MNLANYLRFCLNESIDFILDANHTPRRISDIYTYDDRQLEDDHSFIQWIFPTPRASQYNPRSPVLSIDEIRMIRQNGIIISIIESCKDKMFEYWGLVPYDVKKIQRLNGHNGLRLSRAIECLTYFNVDVSYLLPILKKNLDEGIIVAYYEYVNFPLNEDTVIFLGKDNTMPIWFIRYFEAVLNR